MIRALLATALAASAIGAQEDPRAALYRKCDSQIPWISDGVQLPDCESLGHERSAALRKADDLFAEAKKRATAEKKLILWYIPRQPGHHMNRATILDAYIRVAFFSDPDVVAEVNRSFIPLRCVVTPRLSGDYRLSPFGFVEPGFVFLTPAGEKVHLVDRLRTFNVEWLLDLFRQVLAKKPEFAPKAKAAPASDYEKAVDARGRRDGAAALKFLETAKEPEAAVEKGRVLMHLGRFEESRTELEKAAGAKSARQAEAIYWLSLVDRRTGRAELSKGRWERLVKEFPASPWAWKASSHFATKEDTLPMGPVLHNFEDVAWPPEGALGALPSSTRWARAESDESDMTRRAVDWLLRHQDANGGWTDSRYVYCDTPKILPNVFVAVTSLACASLREWRDIDPARVDAALARGEKYLLDEKNMGRAQNEEMYADGYRLLYLALRQPTLDEKARGAGVALMNKMVGHLARTQGRSGFWAHEYPNPFCTAAVLQCLFAGRKAGATVPDEMVNRAVKALRDLRTKEGRHPYSADKGRPSSAKDSSARNAMGESALLQGGASKAENVARALDEFFEFLGRQEAIRVCDFHADDELGGFFFFHGFYHSTLAARGLDAETRGPYLAKFREHLLKIPEFDGSFIDSHELGKSYGTAMALLSLKNSKP